MTKRSWRRRLLLLVSGADSQSVSHRLSHVDLIHWIWGQAAPGVSPRIGRKTEPLVGLRTASDNSRGCVSDASDSLVRQPLRLVLQPVPLSDGICRHITIDDVCTGGATPDSVVNGAPLFRMLGQVIPLTSRCDRLGVCRLANTERFVGIGLWPNFLGVADRTAEINALRRFQLYQLRKVVPVTACSFPH